MNKKITLDFTQGVEVEVAVMPAHLAQKLIIFYANNLVGVSTKEIVGRFLDEVRDASNKSLEAAVEVAKAWADERALITNIAQGNWDAYVVKPMEEEKTSVVESLNEGVKVIGKINLDDTFGRPHSEASVGV